jgi:mycothiol synthase
VPLGDGLPPGYTSRASRLEDADAVAALANASSVEAFGEPVMSAETLRAVWSDPARDLARRSVVVFAPDGTLAASVDVVSDPPFTEPTVYGDVAKAHRGRGLGTAMIAIADRIAHGVVTAAPPDAQPVLRWTTAVTNHDAASLLQRHGFVSVRQIWLMRIELADAPVEAPTWPPEISVRTFDRAQDERAVYDAFVEGFADHWGDEESSFESFVHRAIDAAGGQYDPSLWLLAMAGDEIAGLAICEPTMQADAASGYVDSLAVRPGFRRRGIARALLLQAFDEFRRRGNPRVALHVDASNPTGARRLYEGVGMTALPREQIWERPLEGDGRA